VLQLNLCGKVRLIFKFKRTEIQKDFMKREHTTEQHDGDDMHLRRITLADGRYMIFYTFGEELDNMQTANNAVNNHVTETESQAVPMSSKEELQDV